MVFVSRKHCSYSTSFTSRFQNTSQSRTLVPTLVTGNLRDVKWLVQDFHPQSDGTGLAGPGAAAGDRRQQRALRPFPALTALPSVGKAVGASLPFSFLLLRGNGETSSTWLSMVSVPYRQAALHIFPAGLLHAAPWDALRPTARGAPQPPPQGAEAQRGKGCPTWPHRQSAPSEALHVSLRSFHVCTRVYFQLPVAARTEFPAGPARKGFRGAWNLEGSWIRSNWK